MDEDKKRAEEEARNKEAVILAEALETTARLEAERERVEKAERERVEEEQRERERLQVEMLRREEEARKEEERKEEERKERSLIAAVRRAEKTTVEILR